MGSDAWWEGAEGASLAAHGRYMKLVEAVQTLLREHGHEVEASVTWHTFEQLKDGLKAAGFQPEGGAPLHAACGKPWSEHQPILGSPSPGRCP